MTAIYQPIDEQGRFDDPEEVPPSSMDHIPAYKDRDRELEVTLFVYPAQFETSAKCNHWSLNWKVGSRDEGTEVFRVLNVLETKKHPEHLTFWGPLTKYADELSKEAVRISLGSLPLEKRRLLEELSWHVPVYPPATNGGWNCQNWIDALINSAIGQGVFTEARWKGICARARRVPTRAGST